MLYRYFVLRKYGAVQSCTPRSRKAIQAIIGTILLVSILSPLSGRMYAFSTDANWGYAMLTYPGGSNIAIVPNGALREIYINGWGQAYWVVLRYNEVTQKYDQVYVSRYYSNSGRIVSIKAADVYRDGKTEVVITTADGQIQLYDPATKALQTTLAANVNSVTGIDIADLDADGTNEIILCASNNLYVYSTAGQLKWNVPGVGGVVVAAQMDADGALEVATSDGHVVDGVTHTVQWTYALGFGRSIVASDIDSDGKAELVSAESWSYVRAYDVDLQLGKWTIDIGVEIGAILVSDMDGDGLPEILTGPRQFGNIFAFDPSTLQKKWTVSNSDYRVSDIAIGDVDNDGSVELLWNSQARLSIAGWQNNRIKWQNLVLSGTLIGPEVGDIDGDGKDEIVLITGGSPSGYSTNGRILVFDAIGRRLHAISSPVMSANANGLHDLKLRDVNADGKPEILVAGDNAYNGLVEIYSFDTANKFTLEWTSDAYKPANSYFTAVEAADIDNDGQVELIAGAGRYLYVYSLLPDPLPLQWKSIDLGGYVSALATADIDQDGIKEIITMQKDSDVYIFSGLGLYKELKAVIAGPFTAMRVRTLVGIPSIVLGKSNGEMLIYRYSSGNYSEIYRRQLVNSSIEGFTIDASNRIWLSTVENGSGTLREMRLNGTTMATYSGYGENALGVRTAVISSAGFFYAAGMYSINTFPLSISSAAGTDVDGDGRSDVLIWRPSSGIWYGLSSLASGTFTSTAWGQTTDKPVPGDYDGDLKSDPAVWRPETGIWYILQSATPGTYASAQWGMPADKPVPGDYDGDGTADIAVWRPSNGMWYILQSATPGTYTGVQWGIPTDIPVSGDYDGDGKTDIAVWRPETGVWYVLSSNLPGTYTAIHWGITTDIPVPGDYDGDGITDIAVWRPSTGMWYNLQSATPGTYTGAQWGIPTDIPVSGDYDGDGKVDKAVWRPSNGVWYILPSGNPGTYTGLQWGMDGDVPVSANTVLLFSINK
jgi:hypothetical protein